MGYSTNHDQYDENLSEQRGDALTLALVLGSALAFVWLVWLVWPLTGKGAPAYAWVSCLILIISLLIVYQLRKIKPRLASLVYLWGVWLSILFAVQSYPALALGYLFFLPLILAGTLVERRDYTWLASACLGGVIWLHWIQDLTRPLELAAQVFGIGVLAFSAHLADRNMNTLLAWIWSSYDKALHSEQQARQGKEDLERVLQSLDDANAYLERANRQLAIVRDQAVEARQLKQQFVQTISHELRTPLNLIVGFSELMVKSPEYYRSALSPAYLRDLDIVYRNALHLQSLVNDVLDLARIEAAQFTLTPELVDPVELVGSLEPIAASLSQVFHLPFELDLESDLPSLWIDPTRIRQVLLNLINNAYRFTERGSVCLKVSRVEDGLVFAVIDTGVGITPEQQKHIFEEFHQVDGSTRRLKGGTGLGLAISKRFIELHNGRIWVESNAGKGSRFSFYLPLRRGDLIVNPADNDQDNALAQFAPDEPGRALLVVSPSLTRDRASGTLYSGLPGNSGQGSESGAHAGGKITSAGGLDRSDFIP